jgi:hypothetical protein
MARGPFPARAEHLRSLTEVTYIHMFRWIRTLKSELTSQATVLRTVFRQFDAIESHSLVYNFID